MRTTRFLLSAAMASLLAACGDDYDDSVAPAPTPAPAFTVVEASGAITAKVAEFRTLVGDPRNGGAVGPSAAGRREIGWDGVSADLNNGDNRFPAAFFNSNVRLGVVMTTLGTGFRNDSSLFADLNPTYATQFATFSPNEVFAPTNSHIADVHFQLAGQPTPGMVSGFGVVFSDVDVGNMQNVPPISRQTEPTSGWTRARASTKPRHPAASARSSCAARAESTNG
jgi:hypothetical protein